MPAIEAAMTRIGDVVVWGMVPTPFDNAGRLDVRSLRRVVHHLLRRGCDGLIALGVIAEPSTLSADEKSEVLITIASAADGVPVVGAMLTRQADQLEREFGALSSVARQVLSAVMIPVTTPSAEGLRAAISDAHQVTGLPVILQDLPRFSGVEIEAQDLAEALNASTGCVAVKCEATPTYERIDHLAQNVRVTLISGFGGLSVVDDVVAGASAVAIGSTATREVAAATRLALIGDYDKAAAAIGRVATQIHYETQPGPNIAIRKHHWMQTGIIDSDVVRAPTLSFAPRLRKHSALYIRGFSGTEPRGI